MTIKELRATTGMSQSQFADYFEIPVRTLQEWEQERKKPAPYIPKLLARVWEAEGDYIHEPQDSEQFKEWYSKITERAKKRQPDVY